MPKKIFTATALFLLFASGSLAQIPSQLIFSRVTKKDGLAADMTFQTVRDSQGFLWIATQNGLQRYDGNRFLTFHHIPGNASTISANSINHLFIDSKSRLWILFDKQAGIFNTSTHNFSEVKIGTPVNMIKKIMEDEQGHIILFADSKQFMYDEAQHSFSANFPLPALPEGYTIGDMAIDPAGKYWLTGKQGSFLYDPKTKQFATKEQNSGKDPLLDSLGPVKNVRYPFIAADGTYWVVNWIPFVGPAPILYSYDKKTQQLKKFEKIRAYKADSYYEIWNVFQQSNGTIWVYGMGLLAYYKPEEKRFVHIKSDPFLQNGIDYDMVNGLYEDKEKNVWVSTNKGLYRFNVDAQVFVNIQNRRLNDTAASPNAVSTIVETQHNGIWVSTWGGGIFSYNDKLQPVPNPVTGADPLNKSLHIGAMTQRRNGEVWMGLHAGELKIYDPIAAKTFSVAPSLLKNERITYMFEDHGGNTWIGSTSGLLVKCENSNWRDTAHSFKTILSEAGDIFKLYEDNNNHLWVCTALTGVYELNLTDGKVVRHLEKNTGKNDGLLNDGASDIIQYNDSIYLIASEGLCIFNSRRNTFRYLTAAEGLPAEHITTLTIDKQKRLWVGLEGGLYRLNNIDTLLLVTFGATDGITNDVFQVSASTVLKDGRVILGTPYDFMVFDPNKTIDTTDPPTVHITGVKLGETYLSVDSVLHLDELALGHDNTFMRIELSTLHFRDQYSIHYMLEGLDKTWREAYNNEITYQYLPPGSYTLKLRSENGESNEFKNISILKIKVNPPFWKTWWFFSIMVLVVGALLFWIDHIRIRRKTAILEMRSNIADELHKDINAALSNITILSEMAKIKADREPEKSKEFIEQIHTKSQNMTLAMDDILWSIDPNNDSMENFMLRFREYIDALRSQYNVQIDVLIDPKAKDLQLKMKIRNSVFGLFKSGITNVVRTGGTNCRVHINYEKPHLIYTLQFDTATMDMKQMNNLRQRAELIKKLEELGATLDFKEHTTNAVFVLSIPVKRDVL